MSRHTPAPIDPRSFIRANLPLTNVPGLPAIRLHRATASSGLRRLAEDDGFGSPYWAYPWPGGLALARYILDTGSVVIGRRVLDLGTGSGLVAIAAAKAGSHAVTATDIDPYALIACGLNAEANDASVATIPPDAVPAALTDIDLVLAGDVFYAADIAARSMAFLESCRDRGIDVLIGDPRRAFLPSDRLSTIADYEVQEVGASASTLKSTVFRLKPYG